MRNRRKGFIPSQTLQDFNLYRFIYYSYLPSMKMKSFLQKDEFIKKDKVIATFFLENQEIKEIKAPFSGKVINSCQIPQDLQEKTSNLILCIFEKCQHIPNPVPDQKGLQFCFYCGQLIWHHYQSSLTHFTIKDIQKILDISLFDITSQNTDSNFLWSVTKNQHITKNTQIATIKNQKLVVQITGKIKFLGDTQKLNSKNKLPNDQHLNQIFLSVAKVVCRHQKIIDLVCQFCLQRVEQLPPVYLFQKRENVHGTSGRALQQLQEQYFNKLMSTKKGVVILDLDNTILHAVAQFSVLEQLEANSELKNEFILLPRQINEQYEGNQFPRILLKIRPYFRQFLQLLIQKYQIYVYTKGTRQYAQQVCFAIRQKYKDLLQQTEFFKNHMMITRDQDPKLQSKSINYVLPSRVEPIIVLDDRRQIWDPGFCLYVKQYMYFKNHEHDKTKNYIDKYVKLDAYLLYAKNVLKFIHKEYFKVIYAIKQNNKSESFEYVKKRYYLSKMHSAYKRKLFNGMKIKFFCDKYQDQNIQTHSLYKRAKRMGIQRVKNQQIPLVVVRTAKLDEKHIQDIKKYSQNLKIPIVSEYWLLLSYEYTYSFQYSKFIAQDSLAQVIEFDFDKYSQLVKQTANQFL